MTYETAIEYRVLNLVAVSEVAGNSINLSNYWLVELRE